MSYLSRLIRWIVCILAFANNIIAALPPDNIILYIPFLLSAMVCCCFIYLNVVIIIFSVDFPSISRLLCACVHSQSCCAVVQRKNVYMQKQMICVMCSPQLNLHITIVQCTHNKITLREASVRERESAPAAGKFICIQNLLKIKCFTMITPRERWLVVQFGWVCACACLFECAFMFARYGDRKSKEQAMKRQARPKIYVYIVTNYHR